MDKTKVDDILMEMIQPRIEEIESRFSKGEGLSDGDVNTLLLKTQYNHINHLDLKLNEVTADVSHLRTEFIDLKGEVAADNVNLRADFADLRTEFSDLRGEVCTDIANLRTEFSGLRGDFKTFEKNIEFKISDAINKNMRWSIGLIALIVTVLKLADTFAK